MYLSSRNTSVDFFSVLRDLRNSPVSLLSKTFCKTSLDRGVKIMWTSRTDFGALAKSQRETWSYYTIVFLHQNPTVVKTILCFFQYFLCHIDIPSLGNLSQSPHLVAKPFHAPRSSSIRRLTNYANDQHLISFDLTFAAISPQPRSALKPRQAWD